MVSGVDFPLNQTIERCWTQLDHMNWHPSRLMNIFQLLRNSVWAERPRCAQAGPALAREYLCQPSKQILPSCELGRFSLL